MPPTAPPAVPPAAVKSAPAGLSLVDENIRRTRRGLWLVDLGSSIVTLLIGVLLYLLAAAVLDHWVVPGGLGGWGRAVLFLLLAGGLCWYAWRAFVPLLQPINPVYAAQTIEASSPGLKNSLLNFLLFRSRREKMSRRVYQAIEQQAAQRLADVPLGAVVDRTALLRLGYLLAAVIAVCAAYQIFSPKNPAVSARRILAPWADVPVPSRVQIDKIQPGDTSVARGERLEISAEVLGARDDEPVRLHYSTVDRQIVNEHLPMQRIDGTMRYEATLPDNGSPDRDADGMRQDLNYWIEAGDARSSDYRVTVYSRPTLIVTAVHYEYPAYTGYRSETIRDTGDIRAIEGTRVRIEAVANQPIETAKIDFDADGRTELAMQVDGDRATATFRLALRDDRRTPEHGSYALRLKTTAGRENRNPPVYQIDVTPDYAPEIRQTAPEESPLDVRVDQAVRIEVEARDPDFALQNVRLQGRVGQRSIDLGQLLDAQHAGNFTGALELTPTQFDLTPGDVLEYRAVAADNRQPAANVVQTPPRQLRIVAPGNRELPPNQQQQEQQNQQQQQPQDGNEGEAGEGGGQGQQAGGGEAQPGEQAEPGEQSGQNGQGQSEQAAENQSEEGGGQGGAPPSGENANDQSAANSAGQNNGDAQPGDQPNQAQPDQGPQDPTQQDQAAGDQPSQPGEANQGQGEQADPLSPEGDQDGEAFERIAEHFDPAEDANQSEDGAQQPQDANRQADNGAQQPQAQDRPQQQNSQPAGQEPQGEQQPEGQPQQPQQDAAGQNQQGDDAGQAGPEQQQPADRQPAESGQDPANAQATDQQPTENQQQQQQSGNADAQNQSPQDGRQDPTQSAEAAPRDAGETPRPDGGQSAEKPPGSTPDNPDGSNSDPSETPPEDPSEQSGMANRNQGEPGDGEQPGEQQGAPAAEPKQPEEKSNSPTESESPDDRAAPGESQGQRESDTQGEQSGDRSGEGQEGAGQQADAPGEGGAGENQPSDQGSGASEQPGPGETGQESGDTPGETGETPADNTAAAEPGEGRPAPGEGQAGEPSSPDGQNPDRQNPEGQQPDAPGSSSSGAPEAGGQPGGQPGASDGPEADPLPGDDPNLDYARQQTDLVLNRLEEQLAERQVDENLLDKLGWSEEELKQFVNRWKGLKQQAAAGDAEDQSQLADALRKLGLRRNRPQRFRAGGTADSLRDLNEAYRTRVPQKYRDQARAYVEGVSSGIESSGGDAAEVDP